VIELQHKAADVQDSAQVASIIRESFHAQAQQLGLTEDEYPRYVAFEKEEGAKQRIIATRVNLLLHHQAGPIGTIGYYAKGDQGTIERLAVLPDHRGRSYGYALLQNAEKELFTLYKCRIISISIAACFERLQRYYESMGYQCAEKKRYSSLPFEVLHMQKTADPPGLELSSPGGQPPFVL
jgi:GNAT superfamily N-acetyltransferase